MIEFWRVIGKACMNQGFRDGTMRKVNKGATPVLKDIHQFLIEENNFLLSRWEVGEINRVFQITEVRALMSEIETDLDAAALPKVDSWNNNLWALVGVACLDDEFCSDLHEAAVKGVGTFSGLVAIFHLSPQEEVPRIRSLFQNEKVNQKMLKISKLAWDRPQSTPPANVKCKWSFKYSEEYEHDPW